MNYRDYFKNNKRAWAKKYRHLIPEGVDPKEFELGVEDELKDHPQLGPGGAAETAAQHLKKRKDWYSAADDAGLEQDECATCGCGDPTDNHSHDEAESGDEYDDNGGLPKVNGVLNIPHLGDPIRMAKIISVGPIGKGPANGELSGYSNVGGSGKGVTKDQGGVPANQSGDKEPITAGGHKPDNSIATKSVGGSVVPGEGQKQGGKNTVGTIADTAKLDESKQKVRRIVKEVLKEITFDKKSGKWVRLDEGGHKAGCKCGFCKNKGTFGKKKKEDKEDKTEEMDENTVDMKMGPSYKTVQPNLVQTSEKDWARTNQYDPEITEMYDEEEECMAEQRYTELANAPRNLNEAEIAEMKDLNEKIEKMALAKRNYGLSQGGVEPNVFEGRCEDFPCCGHAAGECPSRDPKIGKEVYPCAGCGGKLPANSRSSLCPRCITRLHRSMDQDATGQDAENLFGGGEGGYQNENTVNMKMGPSYKKVQPTLTKTSEDDFARTNQYDPEVSEGGEPSGDMQLSEEDIQSLMNDDHIGTSEPETLNTSPTVDTSRKGVEMGHPGQTGGFHNWKCHKCGHEITTKGGNAPLPERWKDGHVCHFVPDEEKDIAEAGGGAVQHSSMRTVGNGGNLPQDPDTRWANDLDEVTKKVSKAVKAIQKGQKTKKTKKNTKLKFQPTKHTTSGVHKRKT
jgi:hypothetical protein